MSRAGLRGLHPGRPARPVAPARGPPRGAPAAAPPPPRPRRPADLGVVAVAYHHQGM